MASALIEEEPVEEPITEKPVEAKPIAVIDVSVAMGLKPFEWAKQVDEVTIETVKPEIWMWEVTYLDGTTFKQFDDKFGFHDFSEVDAEQIKYIRITAFDRCDVPGLVDKTKPIVIRMEKGYKPILFYQDIDIGGVASRLCCAGYDNGTVKTIVTILPDGSVAVTEDIDKFMEEF